MEDLLIKGRRMAFNEIIHHLKMDLEWEGLKKDNKRLCDYIKILRNKLIHLRNGNYLNIVDN